MLPSIKHNLLMIELAEADLQRVAVMVDMALCGMSMSNIPDCDKQDSFNLIATMIRNIYDRIYEAREALEDEYKCRKEG